MITGNPLGRIMNGLSQKCTLLFHKVQKIKVHSIKLNDGKFKIILKIANGFITQCVINHGADCCRKHSGPRFQQVGDFLFGCGVGFFKKRGGWNIFGKKKYPVTTVNKNSKETWNLIFQCREGRRTWRKQMCKNEVAECGLFSSFHTFCWNIWYGYCCRLRP